MTESKGLQKVKNFFKRGSGPRRISTLDITDDIVRDLSRDSSNSHRIRRLKELSDKVLTCKVENPSIAKLWGCIEDIFTKDQADLRNAGFVFLINLVKGQSDELKLLRAQFFRLIKHHENVKDTANRLNLLIVLTNNGKNLQHFEEEVGSFLLEWFPEIRNINKMEEYLEMILNILKFNALYLEGYVLSGFVQCICILCCSSYDSKIVILCLDILEAIVAYGNMPLDSLPQFIGALCRTVNIENYSLPSWKVTRNLLGTHMGHSGLFTMCRILQEPDLQSETLLLRGAIFYIHMALWSTKAVNNLCCPPSSVLPSFLSAVKVNQPAISYEVILGIQVLISRHGTELQNSSWSIILDIISHINKSLEKNLNTTPNNLIVLPLHETLNTIENLIDNGKFNGSIEQFFTIIEESAHNRPEQSVLRLINYISRNISSTEYMWLTKLNNLLVKYFKPDEIRTNIRLAALGILSNLVQLNRQIYEEELIDRIIIPHTLNIDKDSNVTIRSSVAKLLLNLCLSCETKRCLEMLDILEKLLFRPFETYNDYIPVTDSEFADVICLVKGLVDVFIVKIHRLPSSHAIKIYKMLVYFLERHYNKPRVFENCNQVRYVIFECFLKMRANENYHLGYIGADNVVQYSSYLCVASSSRDKSHMGSPLPQSPALSQNTQCTITYVSIRKAFKVFITCLKCEKDWDVLRLVLQEMPKVLQNKPIILSKHGNNELDLLVDVLCAMILDKSLELPQSLNAKVPKPEFHSSVLLVLVTLPCYHACLDQAHQQKMVRCLTKCITNSLRSSPKQCIEALTICTLEMKDVMVKMLPELLLNLSKISATKYIAIPVLEFLSTLTQLPMVFASFVDDQYMAVFAITFPFTNPFKYNHYTVSLAHYVIAIWFLKCRLPIRKNFVKFITNGLQTNVLTPFEESSFLARTDLSKFNLDSSDRKRSSSLTEQGPRRRSATVSGPTSSTQKLVGAAPPVDRSMLTFHEELTETCIDLMARYAFSPCSALPRRLPTAEFLLSGGQSMCWLIGNKLVTITTSGCSQKVLKHGLCDKCLTFCQETRARKTRSGSSEQNIEGEKSLRQNSNEKSNITNSASSPMDENKKITDKLDQLPKKLQQLVAPDSATYEKPLCSCWCQGWAEVFVRRPTGDMSWIMRIQNQISSKTSINDFPLNELSTIFMPTFNTDLVDVTSTGRTNSTEDAFAVGENAHIKEIVASSVPLSIPGSPSRNSPSRQSSHDSVEEEMEGCVYDDGMTSRNPVKRSNSSPEMSNWKNPFLHAKSDDDKMSDEDGGKKNKMHSKDLRVSCEAIPEEMAGTTPPSSDIVVPKTDTTKPQNPQPHMLISCHSYPGSSPPKESNIPPKPYQTVPASPNVTANEIQHSASSSIIEKNSLNKEKSKERKSTGSVERLSDLEPIKRDRTYTNPGMRKPRTEQLRQLNTRPKEAPKSGVNPSFVFLQFYHSVNYGDSKEKPILVGPSAVVRRAISVLDTIPPYETHKIGVIYIREGQIDNETEILKNQFGSLRYVEFLRKLGTLFKLSDVDPQLFFLGGLDQSGEDGKFAYMWEDDVVKIIFHVATMMPNKESDLKMDNKKLHLGNNYVTIVYNDSGEDFNMGITKGQFNFACVVIHPLDHNLNRVVVKCKNELTDLIGTTEPKVVSDQNVAILARQLALHANLASLVHHSLNSNNSNSYASNWLERLRQIKKIKTRMVQEINNQIARERNTYPSEDSASSNSRRKQMHDFTEYTCNM